MPGPRARPLDRRRRRPAPRRAPAGGAIDPLDPGTEDLLRELTPQVLGALVRRYGHFDLAEDAVQEALLAAAARWPVDGRPDRPRAWLVTVASRRLTDLLRAEQARRRREEQEAQQRLPGDWLVPSTDEPGGPADDSLVLLVLCCRPELPVASQVALTLRAVGGLTTREIARAFLVSEDAMTRRITRAKQQVARSGARFALGPAEDWRDRLGAVLRVLYLVFTEGYATTSGPDLGRADLTREAVRLTRTVVRALPDEPEAAGLLALMLLTDARAGARADVDGLPVPLEDQDRSRWDRALLDEGVALVQEALPRGRVGPYQVQAAIAAVHAEARTWEETDWAQIVALYDLLARLDPGPVVRLNRAVAVAMAAGPAAGLELVDALRDDPAVTGGHRWHAVRGGLLERLGRLEEARDAYRRAAEATTSLPHERWLRRRTHELGRRLSGPEDRLRRPP